MQDVYLEVSEGCMPGEPRRAVGKGCTTMVKSRTVRRREELELVVGVGVALWWCDVHYDGVMPKSGRARRWQ